MNNEIKIRNFDRMCLNARIKGTNILSNKNYTVGGRDSEFHQINWKGIDRYKNGNVYRFYKNENEMSDAFEFFSLFDSEAPLLYEDDVESFYNNCVILSTDYPTSVLIPEYADVILRFILSKTRNAVQPIFVKVSLKYQGNAAVPAPIKISYSKGLIAKFLAISQTNDAFTTFDYIVTTDARNADEIEDLKYIKEQKLVGNGMVPYALPIDCLSTNPLNDSHQNLNYSHYWINNYSNPTGYPLSKTSFVKK